MKKKIGVVALACLLALGVGIAIPQIAAAEAPMPAPTPAEIAQRLIEEPELYCFAAWSGIPAEDLAVGKLAFDYRFGYANNLRTPDQWRATWDNRWQGYADAMGLPNMVGTDTCNRVKFARSQLHLVFALR